MDYRNHRLTVGDKNLALKGVVADGERLIIRAQSSTSCGPCTVLVQGGPCPY
jgi:hypothetical protein